MRRPSGPSWSRPLSRNSTAERLPPRSAAAGFARRHGDGTLGTPPPTHLSNTNPLQAYDGVAVAIDGTLDVAKYPEGVVIRSPDATIVATLTNPASLAFRGGTLLVTSCETAAVEGRLYALDLGVCGGAP